MRLATYTTENVIVVAESERDRQILGGDVLGVFRSGEEDMTFVLHNDSKDVVLPKQ